MPLTEVIAAPFDPVRVLCFAPHPDDEVLGPGGALHLHAEGGGEVEVILATDGIAGDPETRFDPTTYAARRREESRRGLAVLGVKEPVCWGFPDSCVVVESDKAMLIERVVAALRASAPEVVYAPWEGDDHSDHLVLGEVVRRGLQAVGFRGEARGYEVWTPIPNPDLVVDITEIQPRKEAALACHESQFAYGDLRHPVFGLNAYRSLLLERDRGFGEAFRRLTL